MTPFYKLNGTDRQTCSETGEYGEACTSKTPLFLVSYKISHNAEVDYINKRTHSGTLSLLSCFGKNCHLKLQIG